MPIARSLLLLCPDHRNTRGAEHWDFSSVASLGRNLFEAVAFFCYFTTPVEAEEWRARLNTMQLNDCTNRLRYFRSIGVEEEVKGFEKAAEDLRKRLSGNSYFAALSPKLQQTVLQGTRPSLYTLREMASAFIPDERVWGLFEFLSAHTHTLPMSFYRTVEHQRTGVRNVVEMGYIGMTMGLSADLLKEVIERFRSDFNELVSFQPVPEHFDPFSFPTTAPADRIAREPSSSSNRAQRRMRERGNRRH